jgi:hypothetical protein
MSHRTVITVRSEVHIKQRNAFNGQNAELLKIKLGNT